MGSENVHVNPRFCPTLEVWNLRSICKFATHACVKGISKIVCNAKNVDRLSFIIHGMAVEQDMKQTCSTQQNKLENNTEISWLCMSMCYNILQESVVHKMLLQISHMIAANVGSSPRPWCQDDNRMTCGTSGCAGAAHFWVHFAFNSKLVKPVVSDHQWLEISVFIPEFALHQ